MTYQEQYGGGSISDKLQLLNKMFRSCSSLDLGLEVGISELFKKVAKDSKFLTWLANKAKTASTVAMDAVSNSVITMVDIYDKLTFDKKLSGIQNVLKGLLTMLWKKITRAFNIDEFNFAEIKDTNRFLEKLKNFIKDNLTIEEIGDQQTKPPIMINVVDFTANVLAAYTQGMDDDEVNDLSFLVDYLVTIKYDAVYLMYKNSQGINILSREDYTIYQNKRKSKDRVQKLDARVKLLNNMKPRRNSFESAKKHLAEQMRINDNLQNDFQFTSLHNNLVNELVWVIDQIPNYQNDKVNLLDSINNDIMKKTLASLNDIAVPTPRFNLAMPNVLKGVWDKVSSLFSVFIKLPDLDVIPFHKLLGLCVFGLSNIFDHIDVFSGGVLQLINISIMLLHYAISFNAKQYSSIVSNIDKPKLTIEGRIKDQKARMKEQDITRLPSLIPARPSRHPPFSGGGQLPAIRGNRNNVGYTNSRKQNSSNRSELGIIGRKITVDGMSLDVEKLKETTKTLIRSNLLSVNQSATYEDIESYDRKLDHLIGKYVSSDEPVDIDNLKNYINDESRRIIEEAMFNNRKRLPNARGRIGNYTNVSQPAVIPTYEIPDYETLNMTVQTNQFIEFATMWLVNNNVQTARMVATGEEHAKLDMFIKKYRLQAGGKHTKLSSRKIKEIEGFLAKIGKDDLYKYCKNKNITVSSSMKKNELVASIVTNHKLARKQKKKST